MQIITISGIFLVAVSIKPDDAIQCYTCNSVNESNCADPFDSKGISTKSCSGVCIKMNGRLTVKDLSSRYVSDETGIIDEMHRYCGSASEGNGCSYTRQGIPWCSCDSDLCNGVALQHVTAIYIVTLVVCATVIARL
ncbi:hypothetical protein LSAT2_020482 [Lamellibrachia satsuma]|nr:hypothetical protein LSAT2_020482 [Lamellibrachia satsuma]